MASLRLLTFIFITIFTPQSLVSAIDSPPFTSTFSSSYSSASSSPAPSATLSTSSPSSPFSFSSSSEALKTPPLYLNPLASITQTLAELGFHDLAMASHSLSLSYASHVSWQGPITVFAPMDSAVRTCPSCSLSLLLQEHTVPGLYPLDYLDRLIFGTKIETILAGKCLTVTSSVNSTKIFIGGAEITRPNLYVSDHVIIHQLHGFISHLSPYSCSIDRMTSLSLPHPSPSAALNKMMMAEAMIRLRTSGYSILALAMRVKYAELITLHNMTIFAVDDSSIFHGGHSYVHSVRFHIVPNRILKLADLESLPAMTVLPTLEIGETLTVTTPGGGGALSPMRINYVKIKYPNLIYNLKMVVHGLAFPFPHLRQSVSAAGRSGFYPIHAGEFRSDERYTTDGNLHQTAETTTTTAPSPVMQSVVDTDDVHHGL